MTIRDQVESTLKMFPETRNSDKKLIVEIWRRWYTDSETVTLDEIMSMPSPESIRRWRQKLQQEGKYVCTDPKVAKARKQNIQEWKHDLGYRTQPQAINDDQINKKLGNGKLF